jgi:hypothetical protein
MSTAQEIITGFELQIDDTTDLSSTEELALANKICDDIYALLPWEFLKKPFTGTTSTTVDYIALPSDFQYIVQNANYTDASYPASRPVVFVGTEYRPYELVSWSDRRQYREKDGYCYVDIVNSRLYFTKQPASSESVEFDYIHIPTHMTLTDSPIFPARFHDAVKYGMAVEDSIIQQSDKAKSYAAENKQLYKGAIDDMRYWNSQLIQL